MTISIIQLFLACCCQSSHPVSPRVFTTTGLELDFVQANDAMNLRFVEIKASEDDSKVKDKDVDR